MINRNDIALQNAIKAASYDIFCMIIDEMKKAHENFNERMHVYMARYKKFGKRKRALLFSGIEEYFIDCKIEFEKKATLIKNYQESDVLRENLEDMKKQKSQARIVLRQYKEDLQKVEEKISKIDPDISQKVKEEKLKRKKEFTNHTTQGSSSDDNSSDNNYYYDYAPLFTCFLQ